MLGKPAQPDKLCRVGEVSEGSDDLCAAALLALDELCFEERDERVTFARHKCVLTQLNDGDQVTGAILPSSSSLNRAR